MKITNIIHKFFRRMPMEITNKIKIIYYDRIDVSERIDVNTTSASKECHVCHYWHFLNFSFKFQPNFCSRCCALLNDVCEP